MKLFCSSCQEDVDRAEIIYHVREFHSRPRNSSSTFYICCGVCKSRVPEEESQFMLEHCHRTGHHVDELFTDWEQVIKTETDRVKELISAGLSLLSQSDQRMEASLLARSYHRGRSEKRRYLEKSDRESSDGESSSEVENDPSVRTSMGNISQKRAKLSKDLESSPNRRIDKSGSYSPRPVKRKTNDVPCAEYGDVRSSKLCSEVEIENPLKYEPSFDGEPAISVPREDSHIDDSSQSVPNKSFRDSYEGTVDASQLQKNDEAQEIRENERIPSSVKKNRRRSWVWKFFERKYDPSIQAKLSECRLCHNGRTLKITSQNVSNLKKHLVTVHRNLELSVDSALTEPKARLEGKELVDVFPLKHQTEDTEKSREANKTGEKKRRISSWIWNHFKPEYDVERKKWTSICKVCSKQGKLTSTLQTVNTSNLKHHYASLHQHPEQPSTLIVPIGTESRSRNSMGKSDDVEVEGTGSQNKIPKGESGKKLWIWRYFKQEHDAKTKKWSTICQLCEDSGRNWAELSTESSSNLEKHLSDSHPGVETDSEQKLSPTGQYEEIIHGNEENPQEPTGKRRKRSWVWKFYERKYDSQRERWISQCRACSCSGRAERGKITGQNTSNLKKHLSEFHPDLGRKQS